MNIRVGQKVPRSRASAPLGEIHTDIHTYAPAPLHLLGNGPYGRTVATTDRRALIAPWHDKPSLLLTGATMLHIYMALGWGFVLPVMSLICLTADVLSGTTPLHHHDERL